MAHPNVDLRQLAERRSNTSLAAASAPRSKEHQLYCLPMGGWGERLAKARALSASGAHSEAERLVEQAIADSSADDLPAMQPEIAEAIARLPIERHATMWQLQATRLATLYRPTSSDVPHDDQVVDSPSGDGSLASEGPLSTPSDSSTPSAAPYRVRTRLGAQLKATLAEVGELVRRVQMDEAERQAKAFVDSLSHAELLEVGESINALAAAFHRKRGIAIERHIALRRYTASREAASASKTPASAQPTQLAPGGAAPATHEARSAIVATTSSMDVPNASEAVSSDRLIFLRERFMSDLDDLSKYHIFQWATFYRELLLDYFREFLEDIAAHEEDATESLDIVRSCLTNHAREIFTKGYNYSIRHGVEHESAVMKALGGLQRFLDLPLEFYLAELQAGEGSEYPSAVRNLCSAMVSGILRGYAYADFGASQGGADLPAYPRWWAFAVPLVTAGDLGELILALEPGPFVSGIEDTMRPLAEAIDRLAESDPSSAPLPSRSQYTHQARKFDLALQLPMSLESRELEVQCFLSEQFVTVGDVEDAVARAVVVLIAPLRADVRAHVRGVDRLAAIVVSTLGGGPEGIASRLQTRLAHLAHKHEVNSADQPITYNYAGEFPLEDTEMLKYNLVYRGSVRHLMRTHERRNGIRLWCSVRRSGKTTASIKDLGPDSEQSVLISQTCEDLGHTDQQQGRERGAFFREVKKALDSGERLPDGFVIQAIARCLPGANAIDGRVVLVLDEYETLFRELQLALENRSTSRYMVVQPLLNQLVGFARDNLLIFMGQQPDAHYILLDQNQLSPLVQQDSFPLFPHNLASPASGEFYELMKKIMTPHVKLDPGFVSLVYKETAGHPYLTVQLMRVFMNWLIALGRPTSALVPLRPELFEEFARSQLTLKSIALSEKDYRLFIHATQEHLSARGRKTDPWLASVYTGLRALRLESPDSMSLAIDDFVEITQLKADGASHYSLLATGSHANFFAYENGVVRPKIPLLARIAASVVVAA